MIVMFSWLRCVHGAAFLRAFRIVLLVAFCTLPGSLGCAARRTVTSTPLNSLAQTSSKAIYGFDLTHADFVGAVTSDEVQEALAVLRKEGRVDRRVISINRIPSTDFPRMRVFTQHWMIDFWKDDTGRWLMLDRSLYIP